MIKWSIQLVIVWVWLSLVQCTHIKACAVCTRCEFVCLQKVKKRTNKSLTTDYEKCNSLAQRSNKLMNEWKKRDANWTSANRQFNLFMISKFFSPNVNGNNRSELLTVFAHHLRQPVFFPLSTNDSLLIRKHIFDLTVDGDAADAATAAATTTAKCSRVKKRNTQREHKNKMQKQNEQTCKHN